MGVDKGHCTEGIRTGSLSNSLLVKEKPVKRGIQRQGERDSLGGQVTRQDDFPLYLLPALYPSPRHLPIVI